MNWTTSRWALGLCAIAIFLSAPLRAAQLVVLDFDTFTDGVSDGGKDYFYSPAERGFITATLNERFAGFPVSFTDVDPGVGLYSKVYFNVGLSDAGDVDFQNTKKIDDASIHIPKLLEIAGFTAPFAMPDVGFASINIAAHETLHLLGTRHHDSFLPVGAGVPTPFIGSGFDPDFPGPAAATLTGKEFNSLTTSIGFSAGKLVDPTLFVGPRAGVKLMLDEFVDVDVDSADANDIMAPQMLVLKTIPIPNKIPAGPGDPEVLFFADVAVVEEGVIEELDPPFGPASEGDYYSFFAAEGDLMHIEVLSSIIDYRLGDTFNPKVALLDPSAAFSPVVWFGESAINDNERESSDSFLFDVAIPATGMYVIEVFSGPPDGFGEYEMLVYRLHQTVVPEPGTLVLGCIAAVAIAFVVRRRRR